MKKKDLKKRIEQLEHELHIVVCSPKSEEGKIIRNRVEIAHQLETVQWFGSFGDYLTKKAFDGFYNLPLSHTKQ